MKHIEKKNFKMKRTQESRGTVLNTLIFMSFMSLKERNGRQKKQKPKLSKSVKYEVQGTPSTKKKKLTWKKASPRHIELLKTSDKENILKAGTERKKDKFMHIETKVSMTADFSSETMQARQHHL